LLARAGVEFAVRPANVDERLAPFEAPTEAAARLAASKARAGASALVDDGRPHWVIGADTIVALAHGTGWRMLGKAADELDAARMLHSLSGTRHLVATGVCVVRCCDGAEWSGVERTWVRMRAITTEEVRGYVASGEWRDKAGAYAIQESADRFVVSLEEGGFDNVVGLPVALTLQLLSRAGAL
jgi:septum formation protein